ncbi:MAG: hypothetical protein U0359_24695 [Byssovorax sp.]
MTRGFLLWGALLGAALAGPAAACVGCALAGCDGRASLDTSLVLDAGPDADAAEEEEASPPPPLDKSSKIDLLLVVDNSPNLDLAHTLLAETMPYLVDRLVHPACVNGLGNVLPTPADSAAPCATGVRDFPPITDMHIGIISTSLGGHGADLCSPTSGTFNSAQDDAAHLLARVPGGGMLPTYAGKGFLAWDPGQTQSPPGDIDEGALAGKLQTLVSGVGESGCGFESQLESFYRFLVDPEPYATIQVIDGKATPSGVDATLLQQRADFLRPDSVLVVLLLTDENDCSTREGSQYYLSNQGSTPGDPKQPFHLPRARSECETSPSDPCCASCGQATPEGCPPTANDPSCQKGPIDPIDDPINLRCFDQKRRFGIDFLYPVERYVSALGEPMIAARDGSLVPNPIFAHNRSPNLVLFGAVLGVPWQDIAKDPKSLASGFTPPNELDWGLLLGDPNNGVPPADPLMIPSIAPRMGQNPATKAALAPPDAPSAQSNPINGHERLIPGKDDLQYACIYPRPMPKDCASGACECEGDAVATNPICQQPDGSYAPIERAARALPGVRELQVIQALGERAAVGSICAPIVTGPDQITFGYRPSVDALLRAIRRRIPSGSTSP